MLPNIGIVGRARTGKDTAAAYLVERYGYARVGLADPLRDLSLRLDPLVRVGWLGRRRRLSDVVAAYGWEQAKTRFPEVRRTLQRLGTDVIRHGIDPDTWVNLCVAEIGRHNASARPVVVPDVRFPNEAAGLPAGASAVLWRMTRSAALHVLPHESESYVDSLPVSREIPNEGGLADLFRAVDAALSTERVGV